MEVRDVIVPCGQLKHPIPPGYSRRFILLCQAGREDIYCIPEEGIVRERLDEPEGLHTALAFGWFCESVEFIKSELEDLAK